jgi:hypothetical protein
MKIYFRKFVPTDCYGLTADCMSNIHFASAFNPNIGPDNTPQDNVRRLYIKLEIVLTKNFKSVTVTQKIDDYSAYFDFNFKDKEDEAHFLLWSSQGIEL